MPISPAGFKWNLSITGHFSRTRALLCLKYNWYDSLALVWIKVQPHSSYLGHRVAFLSACCQGHLPLPFKRFVCPFHPHLCHSNRAPLGLPSYTVGLKTNLVDQGPRPNSSRAPRQLESCLFELSECTSWACVCLTLWI